MFKYVKFMHVYFVFCSQFYSVREDIGHIKEDIGSAKEIKESN